MPKPRTARPRAQLQQGRTDWYRITNLGTGTAVIYVYDEIGYWGTTAGDLVNELSELQGVTAIDLHINSPGGEVFEGIAIYNCLRAHPATITTYVDGIAASIASVIAMAGNRIVMGPHSQMMIHEGSGLCIGDADEMRKMADLLDFQSDNIAGVYAARAGGTVEEWRARMRTETWYTADSAVAAGLADEVADSGTQAPEPAEDAPDMSASWDLTLYAKHPPAADREPTKQTTTLTIDIARALDETTVEALRKAVAERGAAAAAAEFGGTLTMNVSAEPVGTGQDETAAGPESNPPEAPAPAAPMIPLAGENGPEPVEPVPAAAPAAGPEPEDTAVPDDEWTNLTAHLITPPAASTEDDLLAALREA